MYLSDVYTVTANLAGVPAVSVPIGAVDGLPVGGQIMARSLARGLSMLRCGRRARNAERPRMSAVTGGRHRPGGARAAETRTKLFCGDLDEFGAPPNTHVCPVCLGLPGALPVLNAAAVELGVRAALGLDCTDAHDAAFSLARTTSIPTCPRATRSRSSNEPLATGGWLSAGMGTAPQRRVRLRAHPHRGGCRQVAARSHSRRHRASTSIARALRSSRS